MITTLCINTIRLISMAHEQLINAVTIIIVQLLAFLHDVYDVIVGGWHILDQDGKKVTRTTTNGKTLYIKEPGLLPELIGILVGGTTQRDELGHPLTDENGNHLKNNGLIAGILIQQLSHVRSRENENQNSE